MKSDFSLTRQQSAIAGGVSGFIIGAVSGPIVKLVLTIGVLIIFGLIARHIERNFEARLGLTGVVVAILACTAMGPVQRFVGSILGGLLQQSSKLGFALLGIYLATWVHESMMSDASKNGDNENDR